jgi:hypothetical protein
MLIDSFGRPSLGVLLIVGASSGVEEGNVEGSPGPSGIFVDASNGPKAAGLMGSQNHKILNQHL